MSNGQNTGRRYIPKFFTYNGSTEWRPNVAYSAKTIVTKNFKVYTSIVNVPSNVGEPEDNPKYWQPAVISDEVMQTIIDELGKLDGDVSEFEHRVEVLERETGELEVVIGDVEGEVDQLKNALIVNNASGAIASFPDGGDGFPVRDLKVQMEPIQDLHGYDSPWPAGGGKNKWDVSAVIPSGAYSENGERYTANSASSRPIVAFSSEDVDIVLTLETLSGTMTNARLIFYNANGDAVATKWLNNNTSETVSGVSKVQLDYGYNGTIDLTKPMIRLASVTDPTFAPYSNICPISGRTAVRVWREATYDITAGPQLTIELGQTVYGGTLDVTNGVLSVDRAYVTLDSSKIIRDSATRYHVSKANVGNYVPARGGIMNKLRPKGSDEGYSVGGTFFFDANNLQMNAYKAFDTRDEFLSAYGELQICFTVVDPVTIQLTAQQMTTLLGQNNVWSDADSVSVDYVADTKLYIEQLAEPDADMVADANITSGSYFMVGNSLYLATANIANGSNIVVGTNCTRTNLAEALNAINS